MAGTLSVQKIQGLATSAAPTTVEIASGHKLTGAAGSIVIPGMVIQTVYANYATQSSTTSTSFIDSGLTATITPHFATSKINVWMSGNTFSNTTGNGNFRIVRDSTAIYNTDYVQYGDSVGGVLSMNVQDSPNTTSATVYKVMYRSDNGVLVYFNVNDNNNSGVDTEAQMSTLIIQEIAQ
mgnify:FL=1|tara:strand:- start:384 stop:923 length:540 start_codon:yes stop_codon:yes gene_type:complete